MKTIFKMSKQKSQNKGKMSEIDEQILKIFDIKKRLGKGAYGIVWKAIDRKTLQTVAVKKIFDAFRNETDAQRTFREIMFLRAFRNHENIIQLYSIHRAANHMDIYLSFEFMESDLHNVIKRGSILKDIHKRYVMYQLFNATKYIHSGNVIHRDLKPSNVLIDSRCRCKIADFGLARSVAHRQDSANIYNRNGSEEPMLTDYVATRWYRAPEILVASKNYTKGIDLWSLGCILAEMIRGKPLFPGSCTVNQVERIIAALPEVTESDIKSVGAGFGAALLNQNTASLNDVKLDEMLPSATEDSKHLVRSLLVLDPTQRLTAKQALEHKYVEKFRHTLPEPELESDIIPPFRDDVQLSVNEYRSKLYELISNAEKNGFHSSNTTTKSGGGHKKRDHHHNQFGHDGKLLNHHNHHTASSNKSKFLSSKSVQQSNHHHYPYCDSNSSDSKIHTTISTITKTSSQNDFLKKSSIHDSIAQKKNTNGHHRATGGAHGGAHGGASTGGYGSLERPGNATNTKVKPGMPKINYNPVTNTQSMTSSTFSGLDGTTTGASDKLVRRASIDSGYPSGDGNLNSSSLKTKNSSPQLYASTVSDSKLVDIKNNSNSCAAAASAAGDNEFHTSSNSNYFPSCAKSNQTANNASKNLKHYRHSSLDLETRKNTTTTVKKFHKHNSLDLDEWNAAGTNNVNGCNHYNSAAGDTGDGGCAGGGGSSDMFVKMNYESRLKVLEAKIKKHKLDMKSFLKQDSNAKPVMSVSGNGGVSKFYVQPFISDSKLSRSNNNNINNNNNYNNNSSSSSNNNNINNNSFDLLRTKSDNYSRSTGLHPPAKHIYREHHSDYSSTSSSKINRRGTNYGVINASDLLKLRSSELIH